MRAQPAQSLPWRCGYCERSVSSNYAHKCSEYDAARLRALTNGDAGDAIDYALDHIINHRAKLGFLDDWRDGRELGSRWPGYMRWLSVQREGAASAIEARRAETQGGSVADESAVAESETPTPSSARGEQGQ